MKAIIKEFDSHGPMIACVQWWLNAGRYDDHGTAWGRRLELYRDGTVYMRKMMYHPEHGIAFIRRRKWETLYGLRQEHTTWQDMRDHWLIMQKNQEREVVDVEKAKKEK